MDDATGWITLASGVGAAAVSWVGLLMLSWKTIRNSQKAVAVEAVNELGLVSQKSYDDDRREILDILHAQSDRLQQVERFDREFAVVKADLKHVQADVTEIKSGVKGLSSEITGAIQRVAELTGRLSR